MMNFKKLEISLIIPLAIGFTGSFFTSSSVNTWYTTLNKPSFNPPNWIFAPVWTILFIMMGVSLYLVWTAPDSASKKTAYLIFATQLILNVTWSGLFFALQRPLYAGIEIIILWIVILINIVKFYSISKPAGWLLVSYILWVSFASYLNWQIFLLN